MSKEITSVHSLPGMGSSTKKTKKSKKGSTAMAKPKKSKKSSKKKSGQITIAPGNKQRVRIGSRSHLVGYKSNAGVGKVNPAKKGISSAAKSALDQKHMIAAVGAGAALGFLEGSGSLPAGLDVAGIGIPATLAVGAFVGAKAMKSRTLEHVATGLGAIAVYQMAKDAGQPAQPPVVPTSNPTKGMDFDDYEEW